MVENELDCLIKDIDKTKAAIELLQDEIFYCEILLQATKNTYAKQSNELHKLRVKHHGVYDKHINTVLENFSWGLMEV